MAIESYFFNAQETGNTYDRTYTAEDFCNYLELLVGNGVFADPTTSLQVSAGTGMQVIVAPGQGWINGHKMVNTAELPLDIAQSDVVLDRIDRVIFYVDHSTRDMGIEVKTGTAAATPTAPALTQNTSRHELSLATVRVTRQATSFTNSNITDTRSDSSVCGWVTGLIDQIDTTGLFQQFESSFDQWFDWCKDYFTSDTSTASLIAGLRSDLDASMITNDTGSVQLQLTSSSSDLLASFVNLGVGFHTVYANGAVQNVPESKSVRCFGHLPTTTNGYIFAVNYEGSVYTNYLRDGVWQGWRCLYNANPSLLWSGAAYPNNGYTVTPSKALSECRNGWMLTFCGYNTSTSAATDACIQTVCIPKTSYTGGTWGGAMMVFPLAYSLNSNTGAILQTSKAFNVYDDKLVSTAYNVAAASKNMVLRSVQEY